MNTPGSPRPPEPLGVARMVLLTGGWLLTCGIMVGASLSRGDPSGPGILVGPLVWTLTVAGLFAGLTLGAPGRRSSSACARSGAASADGAGYSRAMLRSPSLLVVCLALAACDKPKEAPDAPEKKTADATAPAAPEATPEGAAEPEAAEPHEATTPAPQAQAAVGKPAPDFTLSDLDGTPHTLSDYRGKTVVLEWFNPGCPFVKFAHSEGPLADMAAKEVEQGVVWLAINSGAPGKQGHGVEANREGTQTFGMKHPVLLDEDGAIGHTYGATKTPHVFLVDDEGTLQYMGAIDNAPFGEVDGGAEHRNHLAVALEELRAGKPVSVTQTPSYGCTVKYAKG